MELVPQGGSWINLPLNVQKEFMGKSLFSGGGKRGMARKKVLLINLYSSLAAMAGALLTYIYKDYIEGLLPLVLSLTAGFFIYIALANLIPEIHNREDQKVAFWETVMLFIGVFVVYFAISTLEGSH